jgi:hypothetical protein
VFVAATVVLFGAFAFVRHTSGNLPLR